ncbi:MAG: cell division protein CrgA [Nocardioides sp.]
MSKPRAKRQEFVDPMAGPVFSGRFLMALLLIAAGIAWIAYYYLQVRIDPTVVPTPKAGKPAFMADLRLWNYAIGFGLVLVGLAYCTPQDLLGRGRGVVVGMLGCFLLGLAWIVTYYVVSNNISPIPVFNDLQQYNLLVGIGLMAVGFTFATRWE